MTTEIFQSQCQIFKRISGKWLGGCGFLDGEKLICMDGLYEDVITNNCLVYSFGVGKYNLEGAIKEWWGLDQSVSYRIKICLKIATFPIALAKVSKKNSKGRNF